MSENTNKPSKDPIVNCHTHVFTGDYVPPFLGKSLIIFPLNFLLNIQWLVKFTRWLRPILQQQNPVGQPPIVVFAIRIRRMLASIRAAIKWVLSIPGAFPISQLFEIWLTLQVLFIGYHAIGADAVQEFIPGFLEPIVTWLFDLGIYIDKAGWVDILIVCAAVLFFGMTRRALLSIAKIFMAIPGEMSTALLKRYWQIMEYTKYNRQLDIYDRLKNQYPEQTRFVVLPMDMKYMKAGRMPAIPNEIKTSWRTARRKYFTARQQGDQAAAKKCKRILRAKKKVLKKHSDRDPYYIQLDALEAIKRTRKELILPFVFADPNRIRDERAQNNTERLFDYQLNGSTVELIDCRMRELFHGPNPFAGIKIYPAIGYYPFDIDLLPLWRFCADNDIPIMTHCIKGTIFYRGFKKWKWNRHPVFRDAKDPTKGMRLPEIRGMDYSLNFTHPMNYLCLLDEMLLRQWIHSCLHAIDTSEKQKSDLRQMFGYTDQATPLTNDLSNLKICLGHFGGDDQWERFETEDRGIYTSALNLHPNYGINFTHNVSGKFSHEKIEGTWRDADWYSVICSMMLQHKNLYADISYILHQESIFPLLKQTLVHARDNEAPSNLPELPVHALGERVLFGTDFYVVRSNNADRDLLHQTRALMTEDEFDLIARSNPKSYLATRV